MTAIGGAFTKIGNKSAAGFLLCEDQCDDGDSAYEPIVQAPKDSLWLYQLYISIVKHVYV